MLTVPAEATGIGVFIGKHGAARGDKTKKKTTLGPAIVSHINL